MVEVYQKVELRMRFFVCFEEVFFLVDFFEFEVVIGWGEIDEFVFILQDDFIQVFGVLEKLVVIIVIDNVFVIVFVMDVYVVKNFVVLIMYVLVEWSDDIVEESEFINGFDKCLVCR